MSTHGTITEPSAFRPEPLGSCLYNRMEELARNPKRIGAIVAETGTAITFLKIKDLTLSLVNYLKIIGVSTGDTVCSVASNCWQFPAILTAVNLRAACLSPASAAFTSFELKRQFNDADCKLVFCTLDTLRKVVDGISDCPKVKTIVIIDGDHTTTCKSGTSIRFDSLERISHLPRADSADFNGVNLRDSALLCYSSGTTGSPKGVNGSHFGVVTSFTTMATYYRERIYRRIDPNWDFDRTPTVISLPQYHIFGMAIQALALLLGTPSLIIAKYNAELYLQTLARYKIRAAFVVPPILVMMSRANLSKYDLSNLVHITSAAAPLSQEVVDQVKSSLPNLRYVSQAYGMTEMNGCSHLPLLDEDDPNTVGVIAPCYIQRIIRADGTEARENEPGELRVGGPVIFSGYHNRPDANQESFDAHGFFCTGDVVVQRSERIFIVGRTKELIKVKPGKHIFPGLQVSPAELEDILMAFDKIKDVAVVGKPNERAGEVPVAFVVKADPSLTSHEVSDYLNQRVAHYKRLSGGVMFVNEIPRNPSGKILRKVLKANLTTEKQATHASKL